MDELTEQAREIGQLDPGQIDWLVRFKDFNRPSWERATTKPSPPKVSMEQGFPPVAATPAGDRLRYAVAGLTAGSEPIDIYGAMRRVAMISSACLDRICWSNSRAFYVDPELYVELSRAIPHIQSILETFDEMGNPQDIAHSCMTMRAIAWHWTTKMRDRVRVRRGDG